MDDTPLDPEQLRTLTFLRWLVTLLTGTMIVGLIVLIGLFVTRFPESGRALTLPDRIALPEGVQATAFTQGQTWLAVVTDADEILIYDRDGLTLRQRITIGN